MNMPQKMITLILTMLLSACTLIGCIAPENSGTGLTMTVFSCGKADAILLQFDGHNVLVDAGENGDGEELVAELIAAGVEKLDLLLLTHFDKDHIGGADTILENIPVDTVRFPAYENDSKQYKQLVDALNADTTTIIRMDKDASFSIGAADFTIWASDIAYNGKNDNEQSLVTKVLYGGKSILLAGDAEEDWLHNLVFSTRNLTCDILKLPHHGVYDGNLFTLLTVSMPDTVLITDSVKNPAEDKTMELLDTFGCKTYRTMNGTITVLLQNGQITVTQ